MGSFTSAGRIGYCCKFHLSDILDDCIEYCKYQFEYGQRQSDGATVKEHIEAAMASPFAATLGDKQKQLQEEQESEPPLLPISAQFAWTYFLRLHQTRQAGGFGGFFAITYQEMQAFFALEQTTPEPYELELIRVWDKIALDHLHKEQQRQSKTK